MQTSARWPKAVRGAAWSSTSAGQSCGPDSTSAPPTWRRGRRDRPPEGCGCPPPRYRGARAKSRRPPGSPRPGSPRQPMRGTPTSSARNPPCSESERGASCPACQAQSVPEPRSAGSVYPGLARHRWRPRAGWRISACDSRIHLRSLEDVAEPSSSTDSPRFFGGVPPAIQPERAEPRAHHGAGFARPSCTATV